ncbi:GNAT family N-acetyltransferase [Segniliparus rugosus]|uniref:GNAT family N-acetyltransferase n=1 Tax=Segniliparus rugosus TaxID=286804 RepID=UPI0001F03976|nr:GNAT family N-acetyltransferase [Segniliparus rugosus]
MSEETAMIEEIGPGETARGWSAMRELRPHIPDEEVFVSQVDELQRPLGYRLVGVFPEGSDQAVAVAGFRLNYNLVSGKHLYIDDLSTLPEHRGKGHAARLLAWADEEAERLGCGGVELDSGTAPARATAHRQYFKHGYTITSFHFRKPL